MASEPYMEGGSFTHDEVLYDLRQALQLASRKRVRQFDVDSLKWVLRFDTPGQLRKAKADVKAPILVAPDKSGRPTVVDGLHRLAKAVELGLKTLPGRYLTSRDLLSLRVLREWKQLSGTGLET